VLFIGHIQPLSQLSQLSGGRKYKEFCVAVRKERQIIKYLSGVQYNFVPYDDEFQANALLISEFFA